MENLKDTGQYLEKEEVDFINFWRSIYHGSLNELEEDNSNFIRGLSETSINILKKDMTKTCINFLMKKGGICERKSLVTINNEINQSKIIFGDSYTSGNIKLNFSSDLLKYMIAVYTGEKKFDASERSFKLADGLWLTVILDRIHFTDDSKTVLARSGYFNRDAVSELITKMIVAQIIFFDLLPKKILNIDIGYEKEEMPLFIEILSSLSSYIAKRWIYIESKLWKSNCHTEYLNRLLLLRGEIARHIQMISLQNRRIEILNIFAYTAREIFLNNNDDDFYDVNRSMINISQSLDDDISSRLKTLQPSFESFYAQRDCYHNKYIEIANILDELGKCDLISSWDTVDVFAFYLNFLENKMKNDLISLIRKFRNSYSNNLLIMNYLREQAELYIQIFFSEIYDNLIFKIQKKFNLLSNEIKENIKTWINTNLAYQHIDPDNVIRIYAFWIITCKIRRIIEDQLIQQDKFKNMADEWNKKRISDAKLERKFNKIIEKRFDNIKTWRAEFKLDTRKEEQATLNNIRSGYNFMEILEKIDNERLSLDICLNEVEKLMHQQFSEVLYKISEDLGERKRCFEKFKLMNQVLLDE